MWQAQAPINAPVPGNCGRALARPMRRFRKTALGLPQATCTAPLQAAGMLKTVPKTAAFVNRPNFLHSLNFKTFRNFYAMLGLWGN